MIDPQLADALRREQMSEPQPLLPENEPAPGFKPDGTPWTDEEVEAVWATLREQAAHWPELEASVAQASASGAPSPAS
jgi:hypothetical protein